MSYKGDRYLKIMIKNLGFIALLLFSCQKTTDPSSIAGDWEISFTALGETRYGSLRLNDDKTGNMSIDKNIESLLIPGEESFDFNWEKSGNQLVLKRQDNNFLLIYQIQSASENQIDLLFEQEIQVLLLR